jgi:hypothetical protein
MTKEAKKAAREMKLKQQKMGHSHHMKRNARASGMRVVRLAALP